MVLCGVRIRAIIVETMSGEQIHTMTVLLLGAFKALQSTAIIWIEFNPPVICVGVHVLSWRPQ